MLALSRVGQMVQLWILSFQKIAQKQKSNPLSIRLSAYSSQYPQRIVECIHLKHTLKKQKERCLQKILSSRLGAKKRKFRQPDMIIFDKKIQRSSQDSGSCKTRIVSESKVPTFHHGLHVRRSKGHHEETYLRRQFRLGL